MGLFFREMLKEEIKDLNAVGMKHKKPKVVYKKDIQHGSTNVYRDKRLKAMP